MSEKRITSIRVSAKLLQKAQELGLNVSKACENALREAIAKLEAPNPKIEQDGGSKSESQTSTFSIVAQCPKSFALGVCVATAVPAVGSVVPHVESGVGAIATQASTNILYGIKGLKLLKMGFSPQTALETMLKEDLEREQRQVIMIDKDGRTAAFTGKSTVDWKGHLVGENYVVAGNMLVGSKVIEAMARTFEDSKGELAERLMKTLEAGQRAGGDKRGKKSAALLVVDQQEIRTRPFLDLRVDLHSEPVKELRRIYEACKKWVSQSKSEAP